MSSFFRKSRNNEATEVREATSADVAERAARLGALDEEIKRRDGELQLTNEVEEASPLEPRAEPTRVEAPANGASAPTERLADIEDALYERLSTLARRVEALEKGLEETQRKSAEELRAEQEPLEGRLAELETATSEAARGNDRVYALAGRVDTLEASMQEAQRKGAVELRAEQELLRGRLAEVETSVADATGGDPRVYALAGRVETLEASLHEAQRKSAEQEPLEQRLAELAAATSEAATRNQASEARLGEMLERISERVESFDSRLVATEHRASTSEELLKAMAESILDPKSNQHMDLNT